MNTAKALFFKNSNIELESETSEGIVYRLKDASGMLVGYITEMEDTFIISCKKKYKDEVEKFIFDLNKNINKKIIVFQSYKIEVLSI